MASSKINELAKNLNGFTNKKRLGPVVGTVAKTSPLTVSIADGLILLESGSELVLTKAVQGSRAKGEQMLVVPSEDEQTWYAVGLILT